MLSCSHVFCEFCIGEYVARCLDQGAPAACPTCRAGDCGRAAPLVDANPLAGRIYNRIQCRCPLATQGCEWKGDLGGLQAHLTNSDTHLGLDAKRPAAAEGAAAPESTCFRSADTPQTGRGAAAAAT